MLRKSLLLSLALVALPLHADDVARTVSLMAKIGFADVPSFSPDGKQVAFITNMSGSPQAWVVAAEGGWPRQITAFDDPVTALDWSPDGRWIALQVAPGGGLNEQIVVIHPDGTGLKQLTPGGKANNWLGQWAPDSSVIAISSNRRDGASMDQWLVNVATGESKMFARSPGIGDITDISADGRYALVARLRNRGDSDVYRVALDGSQEVLLTKHDPPAEFVEARFGADSETVFLAGNPGRDRVAFLRVTIANGAARPAEVLFGRDDAELEAFVFNETAAMGALSWNLAGRNELTMVDLQAMKQYPGPRLPADIVGAAEYSPNGLRLALGLSGSAAPWDIWMMHTGTEALKQLTFSPHAGIDVASLVRPELVTYRAHDGIELSGWLYRPRNAASPHPTVLSFHGGPEGQERPSFNSTYQALLANGIAVFAPNVRGSSGFGKKFVNLDNGALRTGSVRDIKATADHLVARGISDPKRLGIMGGSYGGYMVMAGVTEYPDLFAAGVNLFGVVNFETFFRHSEPWMAAVSTIEYGNPATEAAMLRALSPIHKIDRIRTPLLVLHGANDTNVPVIEAEQIVESLKKRKVPVDYILFPDEGHGWLKTSNRIRSTTAIVDFFARRLK